MSTLWRNPRALGAASKVGVCAVASSPRPSGRAHVDQAARPLDLRRHQLQQVGAAGDELRALALGVGHGDRGGQVIGDVAGDAGADRVEHGPGRSDLVGAAIAALKTVMVEEGLLHRVHGVGRADDLDRVAVMHRREAQTGVHPRAAEGDGEGPDWP